ncbi:MAG TPA: hypothetical protein VGR28_08255, partial [Candidatus Thermoplasmatota archaeon]|nr:hypothetical protein [Candidatus Thermoplasmatota archaeon]
MKANRRPGAHADDDQGIAVVVGTVMLVGIVLTTLVTVQLYFVPVWEENDEAARLQTLSRQMAELKADIDRQTDNDT